MPWSSSDNINPVFKFESNQHVLLDYHLQRSFQLIIDSFSQSCSLPVWFVSVLWDPWIQFISVSSDTTNGLENCHIFVLSWTLHLSISKADLGDLSVFGFVQTLFDHLVYANAGWKRDHYCSHVFRVVIMYLSICG